ncbi:MAG: hypothetical protein US58_C0001G0031, partial [Candidatus Magasanikbacteria bacterium GW2011_GWA2_37_8]
EVSIPFGTDSPRMSGSRTPPAARPERSRAHQAPEHCWSEPLEQAPQEGDGHDQEKEPQDHQANDKTDRTH